MSDKLLAMIQENFNSQLVAYAGIVRCKDCKYYEEEKKYCRCEIGLIEAMPDDFCSYGSKK